MKILVMSDSHRDNIKMRQVIERERPFDMVIHCGDIEGGEYFLERLADCTVKIVSGNNDFFSDLDSELEFTVMDRRFWVTHGHYYYVSMSPERIEHEAVSRGVDVVLFGHTHRPYIHESRGVLAINPGSVAFPRQEGRIPTYAVMEIDEDGRIKAEIRELSK
ncbi:MAG: metallophosphoesterase [Lachnospiraceae bacterium]|nr:metallophosphoesterase [Lachnospiraceae bacterium]